MAEAYFGESAPIRKQRKSRKPLIPSDYQGIVDGGADEISEKQVRDVLKMLKKLKGGGDEDLTHTASGRRRQIEDSRKGSTEQGGGWAEDWDTSAAPRFFSAPALKPAVPTFSVVKPKRKSKKQDAIDPRLLHHQLGFDALAEGSGFWVDFKSGFMSVVKPVAGVAKNFLPGPAKAALSAVGLGKPKKPRAKAGASDARRSRGALCAQIMKQRGIKSMAEASKIVKAEGLWTSQK